MNNARIVLLEYGDAPEELYFVPKEGHYLEQVLVSYGDTAILKLYDMLNIKKKWYQSDCKLVELLLTINMDNVKYIVYDE